MCGLLHSTSHTPNGLLDASSSSPQDPPAAPQPPPASFIQHLQESALHKAYAAYAAAAASPLPPSEAGAIVYVPTLTEGNDYPIAQDALHQAIKSSGGYGPEFVGVDHALRARRDESEGGAFSFAEGGGDGSNDVWTARGGSEEMGDMIARWLGEGEDFYNDDFAFMAD